MALQLPIKFYKVIHRPLGMLTVEILICFLLYDLNFKYGENAMGLRNFAEVAMDPKA